MHTISIKSIILILLVFLFCNQLYAKENIISIDSTKAWKITNSLSLTFGQSAYKYWAKGGENSLSGLANYKISAYYKKNKASWENTLETSYGIIQQGDRKVFKTDDKIELTSIYGYKASDYWYYSGLMNFKTQYAEGFKTMDDTLSSSNFMSPGYLITSIGMEYKRTDFNLMLSAMTGKTTFVLNNRLSEEGAFGVDKGKKIKAGFGTYVRFTYKKQLMTNIELNNKLELFSDYFNNPEKVDVNWEILLKMKINKYFSTIFNFNLIYDYDTKYIVKDNQGIILSDEAKVQYKEVFGLAVNFAF